MTGDQRCPTISVRAAGRGDEEDWRRLWAAYLRFYQAEVAADVTDAIWSRILDDASPTNAYVALTDGVVGAFANYILQERTWVLERQCYLEDLFVAPEARQQGMASALIRHLLEAGRANGWANLAWHTQANNRRARCLYDRFSTADEVVRYRVSLQ